MNIVQITAQLRYNFVGLIGHGQYGDVYKVTKNNENFAMKAMRDLPNNVVHHTIIAEDEVSRLRAIRHPFIVGYYEKRRLFIGPEIYLFMEYCNGVNMKDEIQAVRTRTNPDDRFFPVKQIEDWSVQLLLAVAHLHGKGIVHREIKPNNIFLVNNYERIKLGDFSLVKALNKDSSMALSSGRRERESYRAPELWKGRCVRCRVDEWSLGCLLYELMCLQSPFTITNLADIEHAVYVPIPQGQYTNSDLINLVRRLLQANQSDRPHAKEIVDDQTILSAAKVRVWKMIHEPELVFQVAEPEEPEDEFVALQMNPLDATTVEPILSLQSMWSLMVEGYGGSLAFRPFQLDPQYGSYIVQLWLVRRKPGWGIQPEIKYDMRFFVQTVNQPPNAPQLRLKFDITVKFFLSNGASYDFVRCNEDAPDAISKGTIEHLYTEHVFKWDQLDPTKPPLARVNITAKLI